MAQEHIPVTVFTSLHHLLSFITLPVLFSTLQILSTVSVHQMSHIPPSAILSALFFLAKLSSIFRCQMSGYIFPPPQLGTFL